jgi:hypothetical protein
MIPLTEDGLMEFIARVQDLTDPKYEVLLYRPNKIIVPHKFLRMSLLVLYGKHLKFMYRQSPRNARKRSKARQHQSFITPRWAI